ERRTLRDLRQLEPVERLRCGERDQKDAREHVRPSRPVPRRDDCLDERLHWGLIARIESARDRPTPGGWSRRRLRRAVRSEKEAQHVPIVNTVWLAPATVAAFTVGWSATKRR